MAELQIYGMCVGVFQRWGGGCMHASVAMHAPVGLISKQQGRD